MKKRIDWLNHFLEFAVVLIGILIAFQLNNWSQKRSQQRLIELHLKEVIDEVKFNQSALKFSIKKSEEDLNTSTQLLEFIQNKDELYAINSKTFDLFNFGWLYLRDNAYTSLTESGDIRYIKKFEQRKKIIDLYEYFLWTESTNQIAYGSFSTHVQPYLVKNLDYVTSKPQPRAVYENKEFLNGLVTYRYSLQSKIDKLKDCQKKVAEFIEYMEK